MLTPNRVAVVIILILIIAFSFWSKLRFADDTTDAPQRWRIDEHPRLSQ